MRYTKGKQRESPLKGQHGKVTMSTYFNMLTRDAVKKTRRKHAKKGLDVIDDLMKDGKDMLPHTSLNTPMNHVERMTDAVINLSNNVAKISKHMDPFGVKRNGILLGIAGLGAISYTALSKLKQWLNSPASSTTINTTYYKAGLGDLIEGQFKYGNYREMEKLFEAGLTSTMPQSVWLRPNDPLYWKFKDYPGIEKTIDHDGNQVIILSRAKMKSTRLPGMSGTAALASQQDAKRRAMIKVAKNLLKLKQIAKAKSKSVIRKKPLNKTSMFRC